MFTLYITSISGQQFCQFLSTETDRHTETDTQRQTHTDRHTQTDTHTEGKT